MLGSNTHTHTQGRAKMTLKAKRPQEYAKQLTLEESSRQTLLVCVLQSIGHVASTRRYPQIRLAPILITCNGASRGNADQRRLLVSLQLQLVCSSCCLPQLESNRDSCVPLSWCPSQLVPFARIKTLCGSVTVHNVRCRHKKSVTTTRCRFSRGSESTSRRIRMTAQQPASGTRSEFSSACIPNGTQTLEGKPKKRCARHPRRLGSKDQSFENKLHDQQPK